MISLINNDYVKTRHTSLVFLVAIAVFFSTLLAMIFILYANNFIQKQRRQEFALYIVLGLENKHIRRIILIEQLSLWLISSVLSVIIGYTLGNVMFISLNRLMQDTGASLMDYPFDLMAVILTILFLLVIFMLIYLINSLKISRLKAAELMAQKNAGEAEPKSRWGLLILGLMTLIAGYYVALSTNGVLESLTHVFLAILLVIIATYCLFTSLSIIVLKRMKANKNFYYQGQNFLSVSGLLYRMKANASSLASISILCAGLVLTLGTTLTLYLGMDKQVANIMPRAYSLEMLPTAQDEAYNQPDLAVPFMNDVIETLDEDIDMQNLVASQSLMVNAYKEGNQFEVLPVRTEGADIDMNRIAYIIALSQEDFNALYDQEYNLTDHQVLVATTDRQLKKYDEIELAGQNFDMIQLSDQFIPSNMVGNIIYMVVPNMEIIEAIQETYLMGIYGTEDMYEVQLNQTIYFDLAEGQTLNLEDNFFRREDILLRLSSREEISQELYSFNGGFLFLGIIVGTVLMIGIILMLYFKQISEGYDDQNKYRIMKQVGLPDDLIKRTIRSQIFWVFALPLVVAVIHSVAASKIMFELLSLLSIREFSLFAMGYGSILLIFVLVYFILYLMTSRVYYGIINTEGQRI